MFNSQDKEQWSKERGFVRSCPIFQRSCHSPSSWNDDVKTGRRWGQDPTIDNSLFYRYSEHPGIYQVTDATLTRRTRKTKCTVEEKRYERRKWVLASKRTDH